MLWMSENWGLEGSMVGLVQVVVVVGVGGVGGWVLDSSLVAGSERMWREEEVWGEVMGANALVEPQRTATRAMERNNMVDGGQRQLQN